MALRNRHQYCRAHILTQYVNSPYKYTNYIDKSTPQTIGDDNYRLDYVTEYLDDSKQTDIFIGDKTECIVGTITDENPDIAVIDSFKNFTIEDTDYESASNQNTIKFMNTVLHHFKTVFKVKHVEIRDNAILYVDEEHVRISNIYFLKYQAGYYRKNWGFEFIVNSYIIDYKDAIEQLKTYRCNKADIISEMGFFIEEYKTRFDNFLNKINDGELLTDFIRNYKINEDEIDIYFTFLKQNCYNDITIETLYLEL